VPQALAIRVPEADKQGARMQSDAAVKGVVSGVKAPEVSSACVRDFCPSSAYH
jgi:hypothetical protein